MESNDSLTKLAVEKEKVRITLSEKEKRKKEAESKPVEADIPADIQKPTNISRKAQLGQVRMIGLVKIEL
jgi:hypothetical protein